MVGLGANTEVQKQILKSLREFYPIRVDDIVLVAAVQKAIKDASADQIAEDISAMRDNGLVEETVIKAPFGKMETKRLKITSTGIERLQTLEEKEVKGVISAKEIEQRLIDTYDRIKNDLENMRQNLEANQRALESDMNEMQKKISDHDQMIRTYFVRVIETFGVFVGLFAIVVVIMISGENAFKGGSISDYLLFALVVPSVLIVTVLTLLYGIKKLVLMPPKN